MTEYVPFLLFLAFPAVPMNFGNVWVYNRTRLEPMTAAVVGPVAASSAISCCSYCDQPVIGFVAFYFMEESHLCYCTRELDNRPEDPSATMVIYGHQNVPLDCLDLHERGARQDARFSIEPSPGHLATAWCDLVNGGWTVIQRRLDGSVDFYRNWTEYVAGFGDPSGEFWFGLDNIHYLSQNKTELYIYMETFGDVSPVDGYAKYNTFSVANSSLRYRLSLQGFQGSVEDSILQFHSGMKFTTYDRDNDMWYGNCALVHEGAWWYRTCFESNLNGRYLSGAHTTYANGVNWKNPWGFNYSLKTIIMKIKRTL